MKDKQTISTCILIGTGNVAHQMGARLKAIGIEVSTVMGRDETTTKALAAELDSIPLTDTAQISRDADLYLLAVSDDAISEVAAALPVVQGIVAHTSGSVDMEVLDHERRAVLWPVRSMTAHTELDWDTVDLVIESEEESISKLAEKMAGRVKQMSSKQREKAHLVAVVLNNFTNHLLYMADDLCDSADIDLRLFDRLLGETIEKAKFKDPALLQTGPAARGDQKTIEKHLRLLKERDDFMTVYRALSISIITSSNVKKL